MLTFGMLSGTRASLRVLSCATRLKISSTACARVASQPKPSLELDSSLRTLLQDVDISLMPKHQETNGPTTALARELEADETGDRQIKYYDMDHEDYSIEEPIRHREDRKSPAARFGSDGIGAVVLPSELQRTITALIEGSNKTLLHSDARRLFAGEDNSGEGWSTAYDVEYKNRRQRYQHSARDGTAFASVILPAHFSAIYAVLCHVRHRLGPSWSVDRVIDWGAATGSGLWAALNAFQKRPATSEEPLLASSTIATYIGLEQREGLMSIAKQLLQRSDLGALNVTWRKSFHDEYRVDPTEGESTIALSAFMLSAQPSSLSKKNMAKEMWDSGAQTIILIDHNSPVGFQNISEARHFLLELGRKESEVTEMTNRPHRGSHVLAPCPHDRPCPLQLSSSRGLVCGFSQRLQRPTFVRRTKHAKQGHEDIGYSYVVIRRGARPDNTILGVRGQPVGRTGGVEREAKERTTARTGVLRELQRAHEHWHDHTSMNPLSPSFSASAARLASAHAQSPPSTNASSVPADQAQAFVPMVDGVGTGAEHLGPLGRVVTGDASSFMSPRVNVRPSDEITVRTQVQVPPQISTSTPPASAQTLDVTPECHPLTGNSDIPDPEGALGELESPSDLEEALRSEAYGWPRLVFPPLKKSGHVIIDACMREGKIMRFTIPKSQGKQAFYDARKSSWGDIFPHSSKHKPIERFQPANGEAASKQQITQTMKGSDVGKRSKGRDRKNRTPERSYAALDDTLWRERRARWKASKKDLTHEARQFVDAEAENIRQY